MPIPKLLIVTVVIVALAAVIGMALLRSTPKRSTEPAAAATADSGSGLARAMTFTEPKK